MKKKVVFLLWTVLCLTISIAKAQTYKIKSFEGIDAAINLFYKPSSGMLTITHMHDTLYVNDYMTIDTVDILNKVFLQINYVKRAGSNEDATNQLILYISKGRLCQALHINSSLTYDLRPNEYSLFQLKLKLTGNDVGKYKAAIYIHDEHRSKRKPQSNYKNNKIEFLTFDRKYNVFYSNYEKMSGYYTFHIYTDKDGLKSYVNNPTVPIVTIGKDKYYYINGNWYTKDNHELYSMLL